MKWADVSKLFFNTSKFTSILTELGNSSTGLKPATVRCKGCNIPIVVQVRIKNEELDLNP